MLQSEKPRASTLSQLSRGRAGGGGGEMRSGSEWSFPARSLGRPVTKRTPGGTSWRALSCTTLAALQSTGREGGRQKTSWESSATIHVGG